jgi:cell wall-associated NlpC family hydrolase
VQRFLTCRLPRVIGVFFALAVVSAAAHAGPAAADPTLDQKKAEYAKVQKDVRQLDERVEKLTERYNAAVQRLKELHAQIRDATHRLNLAQAHLEFQQSMLSNLLVARYKGLDAGTLDILLGAKSLDDVTGSLDIKQRFEDAVSSAVEEIRRTRDQITRERAALVSAREEVQRQKASIERHRGRIMKMLAKRRILMREVGAQVAIAEAASRINQTELALEAQAWIKADIKANTGDTGAVLRAQVALAGLAQIGVPYKWGGASPEGGFDCSGLIMWLWAKHNIALPHFAASQYAMGPWVEPAELRIGDLVFYHELGHVGMYIGNGYVLHAPHTGSFVMIVPLSTPWFVANYVGATRPGPA